MSSYQIKFEIIDSHPKMVRRLQIPDSITFNQLHKIIQCAFGFHNYHLFEFTINDINIAKTDKIDNAFINNNYLYYTYDFGDNWEIAISIEQIQDKQIEYPVCIECIGPNPVEDSGGVSGFADLLDSLNNPYHPEHESVKEYLESMGFIEIVNIVKLNNELKRCIRIKKQ